MEEMHEIRSGNVFDEIAERVGYRFRNEELLAQALRHSSYVNEQIDSDPQDNERLEFLGDAVLDLAVSHLLMERFHTAEEGRLSKYRAMMVDEAGLCEVATRLELGRFVLLGKGEAQGGGSEKPSILANTMEAVLGAVYLDGGFDKAMEVIRRLFSPFINMVGSNRMLHDYKSLLQEYTQQHHKTLPSYRLVGESGPAHDKTFRVTLTLNGETLAQGEGKSKKEAEQKAAEEAYLSLKEP